MNKPITWSHLILVSLVVIFISATIDGFKDKNGQYRWVNSQMFTDIKIDSSFSDFNSGLYIAVDTSGMDTLGYGTTYLSDVSGAWTDSGDTLIYPTNDRDVLIGGEIEVHKGLNSALDPQLTINGNGDKAQIFLYTDQDSEEGVFWSYGNFANDFNLLSSSNLGIDTFISYFNTEREFGIYDPLRLRVSENYAVRIDGENTFSDTSSANGQKTPKISNIYQTSPSRYLKVMVDGDTLVIPMFNKL